MASRPSSPSAPAPSFLAKSFYVGHFVESPLKSTGLRLSLPSHGEQAEAIYTDFTGTRRKSRVRHQAHAWGTAITEFEVANWPVRAGDDGRSGLFNWLGIDTFAPFLRVGVQSLSKGTSAQPLENRMVGHSNPLRSMEHI